MSTAFTFTYRNDPTYTVVIPDAVTITEEGAQVSISAEDVAWLDGQKVSVTIAGTDAYRNQMVLEGKTADGKNASLRYQFVMEDGSIIETTGGKDQVNGVELASFTENGAVSFTVRPVLSGSSSIKRSGTTQYHDLRHFSGGFGLIPLFGVGSICRANGATWISGR